MPYIPNTDDDRRAMLARIGLENLDALFASIPETLQLDRPLALPPAMGELELSAHMAALARGNVPADGSCGGAVSFLGGGAYDHFIPAVVDFVASRSEYYTSYTPYQPEASQGNLTAFFEYQTLIAQLTGMDVSNASLYDGATAAAEAVLMAMDATRRSGRVVVAAGLHPEYRATLATYLANLQTELRTVAASEGTSPVEAVMAEVDSQTACVLVQHPNFFGCLEEVEVLAEAAHAAGALLVVAVNPTSLGILKRPGDYGADLVVAEGQPLGIPLSFGGPYLGILACREALVRRLPGRLVGQTRDRHGRRCFVLTLQTREQHIRREKATSNICTNQGLLALRAAVYLAAMGPQGLRETAELCLKKAHYASGRLTASGLLQRAFDRPAFHEFVLRVPAGAGHVQPLLRAARREGIFAGLALGRWYDELADCILVAVTEKRTREEIDRLGDVLDRAA